MTPPRLLVPAPCGRARGRGRLRRLLSVVVRHDYPGMNARSYRRLTMPRIAGHARGGGVRTIDAGKHRRSSTTATFAEHSGEGVLSDDGDPVVTGLACFAGQGVGVTGDDKCRLLGDVFADDEAGGMGALFPDLAGLVHLAGQHHMIHGLELEPSEPGLLR